MTPQDRLERQLVAAVRKSLSGAKRPPVPEAGAWIWAWFCDLCATRTYHASGPNPLSFAEIEAYGRLHGFAMRQDHTRMLLAMDRAYIEDANSDRTGRPVRSGQPLTAEAFDAVFGG